MKNAIKEFLEPTNDEKQELWEKCVFVFDTNVLLNLYRYSAKTRTSLLAAFESFKDRIKNKYKIEDLTTSEAVYEDGEKIKDGKTLAQKLNWRRL